MVADLKEMDLGTLLELLRRESKRDGADKRRLSHALANGLIDIAETKAAKIMERGSGNANYFCTEIDGVQVAVSPFASHDGWWERISEGFRSLVKRRGCRWGITLFNLPDKRGIWFEGEEYDLHVLRDHETGNKIDVTRAQRSGFGQAFSNDDEFLRLLKEGIRKPLRTRLIRKTNTR